MSITIIFSAKDIGPLFFHDDTRLSCGHKCVRLEKEHARGGACLCVSLTGTVPQVGKVSGSGPFPIGFFAFCKGETSEVFVLRHFSHF